MTDPTPLHVERIAPTTYVGRNERGAEVRIGASSADGVFSPGELLQLALGACGLLSADHTLAGRLGEEFSARVDISVVKNHVADRYDRLSADILVDMAALEPERRAALIERGERAIDRLCTVGHTLGHGARHDVRIRSGAAPGVL